MVQQAIKSRGLGSALSTHRKLTTVLNFSSKGSDALLWTAGTVHALGACTYIHVSKLKHIK